MKEDITVGSELEYMVGDFEEFMHESIFYELVSIHCDDFVLIDKGSFSLIYDTGLESGSIRETEENINELYNNIVASFIIAREIDMSIETVEGLTDLIKGSALEIYSTEADLERGEIELGSTGFVEHIRFSSQVEAQLNAMSSVDKVIFILKNYGESQ